MADAGLQDSHGLMVSRRDLTPFLVKRYGGKVKKWRKKKSPAIEIEGRKAEIHWYEHHGLGRFEEKVNFLE
jgi:hypothetical protein